MRTKYERASDWVNTLRDKAEHSKEPRTVFLELLRKVQNLNKTKPRSLGTFCFTRGMLLLISCTLGFPAWTGWELEFLDTSSSNMKILYQVSHLRSMLFFHDSRLPLRRVRPPYNGSHSHQRSPVTLATVFANVLIGSGNT